MNVLKSLFIFFCFGKVYFQVTIDNPIFRVGLGGFWMVSGRGVPKKGRHTVGP